MRKGRLNAEGEKVTHAHQPENAGEAVTSVKSHSMVTLKEEPGIVKLVCTHVGDITLKHWRQRQTQVQEELEEPTNSI
jgi:hypothetical protein